MSAETPGALHTGAGSTPVPDPTVLTSAALAREIGGVREILEARILGEVGVINAKLLEADKAVVLLQSKHDRVTDLIDAKVGQLKALHDERFNTVVQQFNGIDTQFLERDTRVKESATATATAVAAALQAAKEAVGEQNKSFTVSIDKSEKATGEQIAQQRVLLDTTTKGLSDKIDDLRERMTRLEGLGLGRSEATSEQRAVVTDQRAGQGAQLAYVVAGISAFVALLTLVGLVVTIVALR